jgi:polysaccharide export outer membrane protein
VSLIAHICLGQVVPPPTPPSTPPAATSPVQTPAPAAHTTAPAASTATGETNALQLPPTKDAPPATDPAAVSKPATPDENVNGAKSPAAIAEPEIRPADPVAAENPKVPESPKIAPIGTPYIIGALDVLDIKIWKAGNLNGIYAVGQDGAIAIPLLGRIRADGLTEDQVASSIRDRLAAKVFVEPPDLSEITVSLLRNNSKKYSVFGAVGRQGEYPLQTTMTVMDVLANCGGFLPFAKQTKIYIQRNGKEIKFNYKEVSHNKKMSQNIQIQNGDRIFVPE